MSGKDSHAHAGDAVLTLTAQVFRQVSVCPDKPFLYLRKGADERVITYAQLWSGACSYARALHEAEVERGKVCIIMLDHSEHLYFAFLGAMLHGAVPSFMPYCTTKQDPELFWKSHGELFRLIDIGALVTFDGDLDRVRRAAPQGRPILVKSGVRLVDEQVPPEAVDGDEVAFLQHSSGTTGLKKGVMLSHRAVFAQIKSYSEMIGLGPESVIASWLPVYHDMGLIACLVMPMVIGATVVHLDSIEWVSQPLSLLEAIEARRASHVWMPNFAFAHIVAARRGRGPWNLSSLKMIGNCSEPCRIDTMERFAATFSDCGIRPETPQVCYAMAETVFAVTQTRVGEPVRALSVSRRRLTERHVASPPESADDERRLAACGSTISGLHLEIRRDGRVLADGEIGEVCVTGDSLYDGYYKRPEITARKLVEGWHHTGDLGFLDNGDLFVTGRMDDLLIVRGRNFYAHEIESAVSAVRGVHPGRVVAFAVEEDAIGTAEIVVIVEPEGGADLSSLRRSIRASVEDVSGLVLSRVHFISAGGLVKTTSGKISRESNKLRYEAGDLHFLEI